MRIIRNSAIIRRPTRIYQVNGPIAFPHRPGLSAPKKPLDKQKDKHIERQTDKAEKTVNDQIKKKSFD